MHHLDECMDEFLCEHCGNTFDYDLRNWLGGKLYCSDCLIDLRTDLEFQIGREKAQEITK